MSKCGQPCEVWSRVVGYMRPINAWNLGKKEEWKNRRTYAVAGIPSNKPQKPSLAKAS